MMFRSKHFALSLGYHIYNDCPIGITVCLGRREPKFNGDMVYKFVVSFSCDWPKAEWRGDVWMLNEPNTVKGLPIPRRGVRAANWTGRPFSLHAIRWYRDFHWVWSD